MARRIFVRSRSFSAIRFIKYVPGDTLCERSAKQTRERERERGKGDMNVSWDVGSTRCSPRFANSLADHDRRHVSVELSKYLARSSAGMLIRAFVRPPWSRYFCPLCEIWMFLTKNERLLQRRAATFQPGMKAARNFEQKWRLANNWRFQRGIYFLLVVL